ncbi:MAG: tyrosine--tRNA ligase [Candidatus Pacebacteria bacterium]|nr:tyrosine--tRNA ligase [Candidatus Paceibacterota bacterium]
MTKVNIDTKKIEEMLTRNVMFLKPQDQLKEQLEGGKVLRIKFGVDPTGNRIHVGRAATIMKLRDFQDMGHQIVLIIGDFTALVGDASDKIKERPMLKKEEIKENLKNYLQEIGRVIDIDKCEIRYNSEWLGKLDFNEIAEIANNFSVAEMLDRENFSKRYKDGVRISLREFLYPLMQGYDSVMVDADVELGGNDQLFNMLAGRTVQKAFKKSQQSVIGTKLLNAADGTKMSTSIGNCIFVDELANEMFGKIMSGKDEEMETYFEALTRVDMDEARKMIADDPRNAKAWLAKEIVAFFHDEKAAEKAEEEFNTIFRDKGKPEEISKVEAKEGIELLDFMVEAHLIVSKTEGRHLLEQNGVKVNEEVVTAQDKVLMDNDEIRVGKRRWAIVKLT